MVVAVAGRRIDAGDSLSSRFPMTKVESVRKKIINFFLDGKPDHMVTSGSCGADLIALDEAKKLNIKLIMVLPFKAAIFKRASVTDRGKNWGALFDSIYNHLKKKSNVIVLNYSENDSKAHEKTNFEILNT